MSKQNIFEKLHQLNEIVDEVKDKVGDGIYMDAMANMRGIYRRINGEEESDVDDEDMFVIRLSCECDDNNFTCLSSVEHFNICKYKYAILEEVPFLAMILNDRFNGQINIPNVKLQMEPIREEYNYIRVFGIVKFLLFFQETLSYRKEKIINTFGLYHYLFKNFKFIESNDTFKSRATSKLEEFIYAPIEVVNLEDFGMQENPFNIWLSHLKN